MRDILREAEDRYIDNQISVTCGLFDDAYLNLHLYTDDFAVWPDVVEAVELEETDTLAVENFIASAFTGLGLLETYGYQFLLIRDANGSIVFSQYLDRETGVRSTLHESIANDMPKTLHSKTQQSYLNTTVLDNIPAHSNAAIFIIDGIPYLCANAPVLNDETDTTFHGTASFGIIIDSTFFEELTHFEETTFFVLTADRSKELDSLATYDSNADSASSYAQLNLDIPGGDSYIVMTRTRIVFSDGYYNISVTLFLLILFSAIASALAFWLILKMIVHPITRLSLDIGKTDGFADGNASVIDVSKYGPAVELYSLGTSINTMIEKLRQSLISLDIFTNIFNGMDSNICVSDVESDEILFINDKMKRDCCLTDSIIGKTRSSALPHRDIYKSLTPTALQSRDLITMWEEHDPSNDHYYRTSGRIIRWMRGKRAYIQHSVDITDIRNAENSLNRRLKQQEILFRVTSGFISNENIPTLISKALSIIGSFLDIDKIYISGLDADSSNLVYKYGWSAEKPNSPPNEDALSCQMTPDNIIFNSFITGIQTYISCSDVSANPSFAEIAPAGCGSIIIAPLVVSGSLWGTLSLSDTNKDSLDQIEIIDATKLFANLISGVIARSNAEEISARLSSIVNASPQFIAYSNENGVFEYVNNGASSIVEYTTDELMCDGLKLFFGDKTASILTTIYANLNKTTDSTYEFDIRSKSGTPIVLLASIFPTEFYNNGFGFIGVDITEMRRLERELTEAKNRADESSKAKGEFLARMSHEMRTPMNAIIGMTNIANAATSDLEKKDYCLRKIGDASVHLLGVINDILDMAKIEANKFEISPAPFEFNKMLNRVIDVVKFRIDEKKQNFTCSVAENIPPRFVGDELRLAQVITNLLSNAVKFTPENGKILLAVEVLGFEENSICILRISIRDTGIGISSENKLKLFRSFEQADGGIARKFGGTGLGLAISKRIVEMMGGDIEVSSELGNGAEFSFSVRLAIDFSESSDLQQNEGNATLDDLTGIFRGHTILLVEDIEINREIVADLLSETQITMDTAENGVIAFNMFQKNPRRYDMVFMDIHMPEQDGYETTRKIRDLDNPYAKQIPIVAMTANVFKEDIEKCIAAGMNDHVGKPLDFNEVLEKLFKYLK
jgi:PAS domain S-box-containing protein